MRSGCGDALPPLRLRNEARQTYACPKNGLSALLSTQSCSLSLNVVEDCLVTMTGSIHALASPPAAAATSSVRETAIASNPLKGAAEDVRHRVTSLVTPWGTRATMR